MYNDIQIIGSAKPKMAMKPSSINPKALRKNVNHVNRNRKFLNVQDSDQPKEVKSNNPSGKMSALNKYYNNNINVQSH